MLLLEGDEKERRDGARIEEIALNLILYFFPMSKKILNSRKSNFIACFKFYFFFIIIKKKICWNLTKENSNKSKKSKVSHNLEEF